MGKTLQCIQESLVTEINSSDAYGLMVDESTDVTSTEKLVVYVTIVGHCRTKTCFLANIDILNGRVAETIFEAVTSWANDKKVNLGHLVGFGSDGASVMVGSMSGVATHLKAVNPFLVSMHCAAHRLALTSSQATRNISYLVSWKRFTLCITISIILLFDLLNFVKCSSCWRNQFARTRKFSVCCLSL